MQPNEMINATPEFVPTPPADKHYVTFSNEELAELLKYPGEETVTFTPDEWNYFAEELQSKTPLSAFLRAKVFVKMVNPPRKFPTPKYDYIPEGGKSPGIDTVTLSPEEWKYFVEELELKRTPFKAFNNAKYLVSLDESFAQKERGEFLQHELIEVDADE